MVSDDLSDQQYLLERARLVKHKDPDESKAWMLTANSLFPDTFSIQFESYTTEREAGNYKECAKCLQRLLKRFPQEDNLWREISSMMEAIQNKNKFQGGSKNEREEFLLKIYDELGEQSQQKVLVQSSEKAGDTMEKCKLLLILMKRFPNLTSKYGQNLIESLIAAEATAKVSDGSPLNSYRKVLVSDVLPVVLGFDKVVLQSELLHKLLFSSLEFVVCLANTGNPSVWEIKEPWKLMFTILEGIGKGLGWSICKNISKSKSETIISSLSGIQRSALQSDQESSQFLQFFYCALVTCFQSVYQYYSLLSTKNQQSILVEAFVTHESDAKVKRRKTTEDSMTPLLSHGPHTSVEDPLLMEFQLACGAWQLLSPPSPPARFHSLLSQLAVSCGSLDPITKFNIDFLLQAGQYRECLQELRQYVFTGGEMKDPAWTQLKLCVAQFCMGDHRAAAQSAVDCLKNYESLPPKSELGAQTAELTQPTQKNRHLRFIAYDQSSVLGYCCKLLTSLLQEGVSAGDMALGHVLVLVQCDWPSLRDLLYLTLHRIKIKQGLVYPLFCQYVINIDILEELTFLSTPRGGGLVLDISPGSRGGARPGTRGANRGEKEDFKLAMQRQAARSHEDVHKLIVEFITKNTDLILQCLA